MLYTFVLINLLDQARRQEIKWGCFCKKSEKWGVFFCKKWTFPQRRVHYVQYQYFLFYILIVGSAYAPNARPLPVDALFFIMHLDYISAIIFAGK